MRSLEKETMSVNSRTGLSRRERDELRAKKEATETEEVLKEFVAAFEEPTNKMNKTFVKGGVFNPGSHEETPSDRGRTYRSNISSSRKSDGPSDRDNLQHQLAKCNAAAMAAAAAVSHSTENKPVCVALILIVSGQNLNHL